MSTPKQVDPLNGLWIVICGVILGAVGFPKVGLAVIAFGVIESFVLLFYRPKI